MPDNKKYFYMKLKEDFFDSEEMIILESMPDGTIYQNILLKMYCRSLKSEGRLMINGVIPYNAQMLASVTRQQAGTVEKALSIFQQLGLIEILDNGAIYMMNIQNFIGSSSSEADRIRNYRKSIKDEMYKCSTNVQQLYTKDKDKDRDRVIDNNNARARAEEPADKIPYKQIMDMYHAICISYPKIRGIDGERKKAVSARYKANPNMEVFKRLFEKAEASKFLQGNNDRQWKADFDFLMNASRFNKVLEGKYDDVEQKPQEQAVKSYDISDVESLQMQKYRNLGSGGIS